MLLRHQDGEIGFHWAFGFLFVLVSVSSYLLWAGVDLLKNPQTFVILFPPYHFIQFFSRKLCDTLRLEHDDWELNCAA